MNILDELEKWLEQYKALCGAASGRDGYMQLEARMNIRKDITETTFKNLPALIAVCRAAEAWDDQRQSPEPHSYREEMKCIAAIQDALAKLSEVRN